MIPSKDLAAAPYPVSWVVNDKNIQFKGETILWRPYQYKQLWFYNRMYYFKEGRVFNMDDHLCGYIEGKHVKLFCNSYPIKIEKSKIP